MGSGDAFFKALSVAEEQKKKRQELWDSFNPTTTAPTVSTPSTVSITGGEKETLRPSDFGLSLDDIGPVKDDDIAPVKEKEEEERTWFKRSSLFDDGYNFGDVTRTILGTAGDVVQNVGAGILGMGEKALDAFAYISPYVAQGQMYSNPMSLQQMEQQEKNFAQSKKEMQEFIKQDLYDESALAQKAADATIGKLGVDTDEHSVFGEKTDALAQSGGQLLGTAALQAVGLPWWLVTGTTSFGGETENAFKNDASYEEAGLSTAITAGAEMLTEKISGGIKFGGKTLDEGLTKKIAANISNKVVRTLTKLGMDMAGEGAEEVLSGAIGAVGQKITYADDKELNELFSKEDAFESFIGGAVLGGLGGANRIRQAKNSGTDYVTELTSNEQKVVDKVYQEELANAEKSGKVTQSQKTKIYDKVLKDMERGYISTETIEDALGGEKMEQYKKEAQWEKSVQDNYDKLSQEYDELYNMKNGEKSSKQVDREAELKEMLPKLKKQLDNVKATSTTKQTRQEISKAVQEMVRGERLTESYSEVARAREDFQSDMKQFEGSKHPEAAKEAIESAIKAGANNTNRVHDFVEMVAKTASETGLKFQFKSGEQVKAEFIEAKTKAIKNLDAIPEEQRTAEQSKKLNDLRDLVAKVESGETKVNGNISNGVIELNLDSAKPLNRVVGHEVTHSFEPAKGETSKDYDDLKKHLFSYAETKGINIQQEIENRKLTYEGITDADPEAELVADLVGDFLFTDPEYVKRLSTENRTVFQKIYDEIKYLYKVATAGSKEARELEKVKRAFDKAYRESAKTQTDTKSDTKYSVSEVESYSDYADEKSVFRSGWLGSNPKMVEAIVNNREQTKTTQFASWFGNSKATNTNNEPLLVYHGTESRFTEFKSDGKPIWFSPDVMYSRGGATQTNAADKILPSGKVFGGANERVIPAYIKAENPADFGNTSLLFEDVVSDIAQNLGIDEAALRNVWEKTGRNAELYKTVHSAEMVELLKQHGYDSIKAIEVGSPTWAVFDSNQAKSAVANNGSFNISNPDIRYSLSDSDGRQLTKEQQEYFKDSKVRDENGNLKVMYHGTSAGGHTMFDPYGKAKYGLFGAGSYFTDNKAVAESYTKKGKGKNPQVYETYLNIKNPMDMDAQADPAAWAKAFPDASFPESGTNEQFYRAMEEYFEDEMYPRWEAAEEAMMAIEDMGFDGITHIGGGRFNKTDETRHRVYIAFQPEQIKNVDNAKPTADPDIRYSLSDSEGRKLSENQVEFFKDSKIRDENGNLKIMYHGSPASFTVFDKKKAKSSGYYGKGFYFTDSDSHAKQYGNTYEVYLNITNPLKDGTKDITKDQIRKFVEAIAENEDYGIENYGYDATVDSVTDSVYGKSDFAMLMDINATSVGNMVEAIELFNEVNGTDYNGIVANTETVAFYPEQIKTINNQNPTDNQDINLSLSNKSEGFAPVGSSDIFGKDILRSDAEVAPVAENATPNSTEQPVTQLPEENSTPEEDLFPDDLAPMPLELDRLMAEQSELRQALESAMNQGDYSQISRLTGEYEAVTARIRELESQESDRVSSIDEADMPPEAELYPGEPNEPMEPADPFADRDMVEVGKRSVKAYMDEHPEVKPFFKTAAEGMLGDLSRSIKGERLFNDQVYYDSGGEKGWMGTKRTTTADIADLLDNWGASYAQIEEALNSIIEDGNKNALAKRIEFMLDDRLRNGYTDVYGEYMPPDQGYIDLLNDRVRSVETREAFDNLVRNGDQYAPPDEIGPVTEVATKTTASGQEVLEEMRIAPEPQGTYDIAPTYDVEGKKGVPDGQQAFMPDAGVPKRITKKELHTSIMDKIKAAFASKGYDFDKVLDKAKNLSTFATVDNTPQRVMEKELGYKEGGILADLTINKVAQNETQGIRWLNSFTDRKNGLLSQISKQYRIKPGSKESAAAQMYAEGFYVDENDNIIAYGDKELAADFPDAATQHRIKGLAGDPRIRQIYDETLNAINESRVRNGYPEIPRLDNYFLHFRAMEDTFSRLGLPFNPNDIRAKDLPTDLNGVTADLKPGQPFFASAMHRTGMRTSFDMLGGLEKYLSSAKNQIYHIDDIQTFRALRNYIADSYGQAKGLESLDTLSDEEAQHRIEQVYDSHLSTFAKFLNEEANVLAGKTSLTDRGIEGVIGRRGITFLETLNRQVGANMVGFNVASAGTNFLSVFQAMAKSNKYDFVKAFAQASANQVQSIFGKSDGFAENSPVIIRRKGAESFYRTPWQKAGDMGYGLMSVVDNISTELIARTKYNELTRKGMDSQTAHFETDKWVSKLMGDRSLGQQPQLYNSKMLGLLTKFQLEVRNQLDSQFYDTIQEAKVSTEDIQNGLVRNAKKAAKIGSTFAQLAVLQHIFGAAYESVAGYNPAFDIIDVIIKTFGLDDDEEDEDTALDNIQEGFLALLGDMPYTSFATGGRIPISSALPVNELLTGKDQYGNEKPGWYTAIEAAPYYFTPGGYSQLKKSAAGLEMFNEEHPIAGSYTKTGAFEDGYQFGDITKTALGTATEGGKLRFPVEDTPLNRMQAAVFGQWANENAKDYINGSSKSSVEIIKPVWESLLGMINQEKQSAGSGIAGQEKKNAEKNYAFEKRSPLNEKQMEEFVDLDIPIQQYWEIQDGLKGLKTLDEKADYIADLDLPLVKKNKLVNNRTDRKEYINLNGYHKYGDFEEFDFAVHEPEKYEVALAVGGFKKYMTYKEGMKGMDKLEEKIDYVAKLDLTIEQKNKFANSLTDRKEPIDLTGYENYGSYDEWDYATKYPKYHALSKVVGGYETYYNEYYKTLKEIKADKDEYGESISGTKRPKVESYVYSLDIPDIQKHILFKSQYNSDNSHNREILDYLNNNQELTYEEKVYVLDALGAKVLQDGSIKW